MESNHGKLCCDCDYFQPGCGTYFGLIGPQCTHPELAEYGDPTGESKPFCAEMRKDGSPCGPEADYYEHDAFKRNVEVQLEKIGDRLRVLERKAKI